MRLTCPNCDARYEVPEDAIPDEGREVQCSSCGHSWFQSRDEAQAESRPESRPESPDDALRGDDGDLAATAEDGDPASTPSGADEAAVPFDADGEYAPAGPPEGVSDEESSPAAAIDESVRAILREEAEHEASLRRAEAAAPPQGDSGERRPADAGAASKEATGADTGRKDAARTGAAGAAAGRATGGAPSMSPGPLRSPKEGRDAPSATGSFIKAPPITAAAPRRALLPDVEEITSTLRPAGAAAGIGFNPEAGPASQAVSVAGKRGGFRGGFLLALALLFLASALYISADNLALQVPALAGTLDAYVTLVDSLRHWINTMAERATSALQGDGAG